MRCTALALCLCAALVGSAMARPGSLGFGGGHHGDGGRRGDRPGRPGWGAWGPDGDAINVTISIDREAFLTGELNEDFCAEVANSGKMGGWSALDTIDDVNELELADEEIRNVTLAVMARALPRGVRCRPENRTETIEGCSRVVDGTEYQLRLTVTCERRNRTDGSAVEVTGVVDAFVAIPANDVPSINITGVELSIADEWVNATQLVEGADDRRPGGFPGQTRPPVDPLGPQDMSNGQPQDEPKGQPNGQPNGQPQDEPKGQPGSGDQPEAPEKPSGDGSQLQPPASAKPEDGQGDAEPLL